jgi:uncharacterized lipoprotein YmbA
MNRRVVVCALLISLAIATGCSSSPQPHFYTLSPDLPQSTVGASPFAHSVSIGPVTLPEVVNRAQFVVSAGSNRVLVLEQRRWAEPLKDALAEGLAEYLGRDLGGARVTPFAQTASINAQFEIAIDVQQFEMIEGEAAVLDVVWSIRRRGTTDFAPVVGHSAVREPVTAGTDAYDALVAAQVRALATVSREIAASLVQVSSA